MQPLSEKDGRSIFFGKDEELLKILVQLPQGIARVENSEDPELTKTPVLREYVHKCYKDVEAYLKRQRLNTPSLSCASTDTALDIEKLFQKIHLKLAYKKQFLLRGLHLRMPVIYCPSFSRGQLCEAFQQDIAEVKNDFLEV